MLGEEGAGKLHSLGKALAIHVKLGAEWRQWLELMCVECVCVELRNDLPGGLNGCSGMVDKSHIYWVCSFLLYTAEKDFPSSPVHACRGSPKAAISRGFPI